jgi:hypothetical protein
MTDKDRKGGPHYRQDVHSTDDGWNTVNCTSRGWNHFKLPAWGTDIDVYVEDADWDDGVGNNFKGLGPPGTKGGIRFGIDNGFQVWLDSKFPQPPTAFLGAKQHRLLFHCWRRLLRRQWRPHLLRNWVCSEDSPPPDGLKGKCK